MRCSRLRRSTFRERAKPCSSLCAGCTLIAGITWVGLLYFFNLVNIPFQRELDAKTRLAVVPNLMPKALWWFRWSSVVTVLAGIAYWMHIVGSDVRNAVAAGEQASSGAMIGGFFVIWTLAFAIEMGVLMSPAEGLKKGPVLGVIVAIVLLAACLRVPGHESAWLGEQSRTGHRHWRRAGLVHDAERVGHHLAHAEEDHPLDGGRGARCSHAG